MPIHLIPQKTNFRFTSKRRIAIAVSLLVIIGTFTLMFTKGFNYGIDFTGGILIELQTEKSVSLADVRKNLPHSSTLQQAGNDGTMIIRVPLDKIKSNEEIVKELKQTLAEKINGKIEYRKVDYVGPQVGSELIQSAIVALFAAFGLLMVYVWIRFEWQYGVGAMLSLIHDSIAVIGFYIITGLEFDLTSVAAILTVVGYSINDTVVIYDRVRENMRKYKKMSLEELIDISINETMSRTVLTVLTVVLALVCLIIFGGDNLQTFSQGMLFGVVIGTFSSIYVSALALFYLDPRQPSEND